MATKAAELFAEVGAETSQYERKMRQAGQTFDKTTRDMKQQADQMTGAIAGGLGGIAGALGIGGALMLGKQIVGMAGDLAQAGMQVQALERNFVALSGEGIASLEGLRRATRGMVSDAELMQSATQYLAMGLADTSKQAGDLIGVATQLALVMGRDVSGAVGEFAQLLANQSMMRLDQFGISASRVEARMKDLQLANKGMTKETAFTTATMAEAQITLARVGDQADTGLGQTAKLQAGWANLRAELGKRIDATVAMKVISEFVEGQATNLQAGDERNQAKERLADTLHQMQSAGAVTQEEAGKIIKQYILLENAFAQGEVAQTEYLYTINQMIKALEREGYWIDLTADAAMREHDEIRQTISLKVAERQARQENAAAAQAEAAMVMKSYAVGPDPWRVTGPSAGVLYYEENKDKIALDRQKQLTAAIGNYNWTVADTAGRVAILRDKIAGVKEGTAEWYDLQAQLVLQEQSLGRSMSSTSKQLDLRADKLRSLAEGALSPTRVTDIDMARTRLGDYAGNEKWDEYVRRLRSAATDAKSAWKDMIPEDVLARGTDAVKVWAAEQERLFYSGQLRAEDWERGGVNWDAVLADIQREMQAQQSREALINEAMQRAAAAGLGANVGQIREALGVGQTYSEIGADVAGGMTAGMGGVNIAAQVTTTFEADLKKQQERYVTQGQLMVSWLATGVKDGTPALASDLALALFPALQRLFANASPRL